MTEETTAIQMKGLEGVDGTAALIRAEVRDGMGRITEIDVEFVSNAVNLKFADVLGLTISIGVETEDGGMTWFTGRCTGIAFQGQLRFMAFYYMRLVAWPWYLTQTTDCRIFQEKTTKEIIEDVVEDQGFTSDLEFDLLEPGKLLARPYCVQYRETAYDFLYRLMVEDGLTFFIRHGDGEDKLVIVDSPVSLPPEEGAESVRFRYKRMLTYSDTDVVYEWNPMRVARSAKVTIDDYDYEKARASIGASKQVPGAAADGPSLEIYDYPGRYFRSWEAGDSSGSRAHNADHLVSAWAESIESELERATAVGNARRIVAGHRFVLTEHERQSTNDKYTVLRAVHQLQIDSDYGEEELADSLLTRYATLPPLPLQGETQQTVTGDFERYRVTFEVQPGETPVRLAHDCARPVIPGLQTAVVVGEGEREVHTDAYGRIKIQFHWDRLGNADEKSSWWVRTALPWTGGDCGMIFVRRVGQEVVVQFEEGDPDRPVVAGMLYNSRNGPPIEADLLHHQIGLRSRSTSEGGTGDYNELIFDDKTDNELVRFRAQKDYSQTVLNDATVDVGSSAETDGGNLSITVQNNIDTVSKAGNRSTDVQDGTDSLTVAKDRTVKVSGTSSHTAVEDLTVSTSANSSHTASGTLTQSASGDSSYSSAADMTISATNITITADSEVKIEAGGTSITINSDGVTLKGGTIKHNP